jgi:hypothetical protein
MIPDQPARDTARALYGDRREVAAQIDNALGRIEDWAITIRVDVDAGRDAIPAARALHDHAVTLLLVLAGRTDPGQPTMITR